MRPTAKIYCYGGDIEPCNSDNISANTDGKNKSSGDNDCNRNSTGLFYALDINKDSNFNNLQSSWEFLDGDGQHVGQNKFFTLSPITAGDNQIKIVNLFHNRYKALLL